MLSGHQLQMLFAQKGWTRRPSPPLCVAPLRTAAQARLQPGCCFSRVGLCSWGSTEGQGLSAASTHPSCAALTVLRWLFTHRT